MHMHGVAHRSHDAGEHKATPEMKAGGDKSKPERFLPLNASVYSFCPWLLRRGRRRSGGRPEGLKSLPPAWNATTPGNKQPAAPHRHNSALAHTVALHGARARARTNAIRTCAATVRALNMSRDCTRTVSAIATLRLRGRHGHSGSHQRDE